MPLWLTILETNMRKFLTATLLIFGTTAAANETAATLIRNSVLNENMRLHIATFDTNAGEAYNWENCQLAAKLFQAQPNVTTRFWCEKGKFKD
jgi:hypothetical protein